MVELNSQKEATAPMAASSDIQGFSKNSKTPVDGSQTKSIMNVSGTSGQVVNNTPEPGLKRVPTVTFSDVKPVVSASKPGETIVDGGKKPEVDFINGFKSSNISSATNGASVINETRATSNNVNNNMVNINSSSIPLRSRSPDLIDPIAFSIPSDLKPPNEGDHLHFIVGDSLHTPGRNSTLTSPRSSVGSSKTPDFQIPIPDEAPILAKIPINIPKALEAVLEEGSTNSLPSKILKRENSKNIDPRLPQDDGKLHVLIGATGAISVFKIKVIIKKLEEIYGRDKIAIQVILTQAASQFFSKKYSKKNSKIASRVSSDAAITSAATAQTQNNIDNVEKKLEEPVADGNINPGVFTELPSHIHVWTDNDEWDAWRQRTDPVLHIELRRWADILVIAPLTANTLTKIALGLCDNLLTSVVRAWNPAFPIFLAPSMFSSTFNAAMTKKHLRVIKEEMSWITVFKPIEKVMSINGDIGLGGMMDSNEIVDKIVMQLGGYPKNIEDEEEEEEEEEEDDKSKLSIKNKQDEIEEDDDDDDDDDDEDDDDDDDDYDDDDDDDDDDVDDVTTTATLPTDDISASVST